MGQILLSQSTEILIDQIPLGILTFSSHGRVEFINQNFHKLGLLYQFNTSLLNINIFKYNLFPPINIIEELKSVVKGRPFEKEIKHIKTNDGRMISLIVKGSPVYEEESISGGMLLIEDLQFSSESGEDSPKRLTYDYINKGDIFFIVTDTSGDIKYSAGKEIQGSNLLRREITGRNISEIFQSSIKEKIIQSFNNAVKFGKAQFLQIEFVINDSVKKFNCSVEPIIGENGFVQVIYLVFKESPIPPEEINSMVESLKKLEYYKEISRKKDTGLLLIDSNGNVIDWDEQFEIISGIIRTDISPSVSRLFSSVNQGELFKIIHQLDDENSCELITYLENRISGKLLVHLNFYKSIEDRNQIIVLCSRIKLDSAIIKQAEKKPLKITEKIQPVVQVTSRNIYQSMFEVASDGIAVELNERITLANDSFAKTFGYSDAKELEGKNLLELTSEDSIASVTQYLINKRTSKPGRERLEFIARKKDGLIFYAEFCAFELKENDQKHLVLIFRDVTERKRMREAAKDSDQKYRNIAENIDDLLYTFERFGGKMFPTYYSKAIEKISGYTQTEFLSDQRLFLKIIHPDDFRDLKKRLSFLWKTDVQVTSEFEFRIINKSGNVVWVRNKINVVRNSDGNIQKVYGLISDITFNKRAEEELKQSAANLKKLNDAKDRFLSIISHDLRAPFSSILGFTDLLLEDDTLTDVEKLQYIVYIQDSSKSMLALVNSMLDWTRLQTGRIKFEPEKINAREIIESSINTVSGTALKKGVEIENLIEPALHIFGDKNLILQVFNNLLSNAVKFTKLGDRIMITVNVSQTSRFITFSVKDTGTGIKEINLDKLFSIETKYTSEGTAGEKGSGLGLSLVKDIIEKHGGRIEVKSEFGRGTEFMFTLPVASTKILLIDSNNRERMFYSKVLINITTDYAVNVVSNGKEALERIIQSPPALVITEHKMPIMGGLQLIQELIKNNLRESIPVIVLTGDIERAEIQEYTNLGIEYIFNKPVNLINFKTAIEKSLKKRNH
ncbi:MAG: PAS domain S-box protein [Ignavibacteriales bacterium]